MTADTTSAPPPPLRAHLLRAAHEWLSEHGHTPYLQVLVDAYVRVPPEYVRDGSIVLNISWGSTNRLMLGDEWIEFQARFNGQVREILVPIDHVVNLFSKETQEGYQAMSGEEFIAIREGRYQPPDAPAAAQPRSTPTAPTSAASADSPPPATPVKKGGITRIK